MPTLGSVSGNALASLTSIDKWIATLNSTVGGAARTGFKTSKITFGGGTTMIERFAQGGALGIQFAEQALSVGSTNVDFSEGQIAASTEFTHIALNGSQNAFFMVSDREIDPNSGDVSQGTKFYYTRDGEFFLDDQRRLRTRDGLFVVGRRIDNAGATIGTDVINPAGTPGSIWATLTIPQAVTDPETYLNDVLEAHNTPPANYNTLATQGGRSIFAHAFIKDLQDLRFSKYGSTVYEQADPSLPADESTSIDFFDVATPGSVREKVRVSGNSLEASNVQLPSSLTELSLAQKIYAALTKVIQIDQQKLDGIMNLIR